MANYPLEITYPKAIGAAGTGLDSNSRCYRAYPSLTYRIRVGAIGGDYPYTYSLSNAPSGMSIDHTGLIEWTNPTSNASNITVTVTDSASPTPDTDSATWSITVTESGFVFLSGTGSDANSGTLASPWRTLDKLYDNPSAGQIAYLRTGTYDFTGVPVSTGATVYDDRCVFDASSNRCIIWLAYPGESPIIDYGSNHTDPGGRAPALRFSGSYTFVDGLHFTNGFNKFLWMDRTGSRGMVVINCVFDGLGPGAAGSNAACIMFTHALGAHTYNDVILANRFTDIGHGNSEICAIKVYDTRKMLVADNIFDHIDASETVAFKDATVQYTFRGNTGYDTIVHTMLAGNMHGTAGVNTYGEVCFNNLKATTWVLQFNQDSVALQTDYYRNTFVGRIYGRNVDANDGPFTFTNNVIVNSDGAQTPWNFIFDEFNAGGDAIPPQDASRVSVVASLTPTGTQNLAGAATDNIVDANGSLQGSYRTNFFGTKGHELAPVVPVSRGGHLGRVAAI